MYLSALVYYYALSLTSLASTIVLNNTSMMFVFLLSLFILKQKFDISKMMGVVVASLGVFIIVLSDKEPEEKNSMLGNIVGVIDAIIYAVYYIYLEKILKTSLGNKVLYFGLFGFIGLITLSLSWLILLVSHYTGAEIFEIPS